MSGVSAQLCCKYSQASDTVLAFKDVMVRGGKETHMQIMSASNGKRYFRDKNKGETVIRE